MSQEATLILTGADDEWLPAIPPYTTLQNKLCPRVYKDAVTGIAYDSEGLVFVRGGWHFVTLDSSIAITFPYTPNTEYFYE